MTRLLFVRHAQPEHAWEDDRTRPLTEEGLQDARIVLDVLKDEQVDLFFCSPYKRSIDTIAETAQYFQKQIIIDERLRERQKGPEGNVHGMFQKRWADYSYHEAGGESLQMVQERNMEALKEILEKYPDKTIVIGTHGTALSTIMNYYEPGFGCDDFLRIIDWMPYVVELDIESGKIVNKVEHTYIYKEFKGKARADKEKQ